MKEIPTGKSTRYWYRFEEGRDNYNLGSNNHWWYIMIVDDDGRMVHDHPLNIRGRDFKYMDDAVARIEAAGIKNYFEK